MANPQPFTKEELARFKEVYERDGPTAALALELSDVAFARGFYRTPGSFRLTKGRRLKLAEFFADSAAANVGLAKVELFIDVYRRAANRKPDGTRKTGRRLANNLVATANSAEHLRKCLATLVGQDGISLWSLFPGISGEVIANLPRALENLRAKCISDATWILPPANPSGTKKAGRPPRNAEKALVEQLVFVFLDHGEHEGAGVTQPCFEFVQAVIQYARVEIGEQGLLRSYIKPAIKRWRNQGHVAARD